MILGITLARGGSKGLPRKNVRMCAGKPLIVWTIEAAKEAKLIDKYVVSTDDDEITEVAESYGVDVLRRPDNLSDGETNRWDVLKYHLKEFPSSTSVVLLQATSPVRHIGLIDECITEFRAMKYDSYATGFYKHDIPYPENRGENRQLLGVRSFDDGNVYIWSRNLIENNEKQEPGAKWGFRELNPLENIDINNEYDLLMAEGVLLNENLIR